ncbi:MAG: hypothetical protein ACHQ15_02945 [Candidatus Limnocylindrales bacterium]
MSQAIQRPSLRSGVLALVAFVLAHDVIFLLTYGAAAGTALAQSGHDARWTATVVVVAELGFALLVAGVARLSHLSGLAGSFNDSGDTVAARPVGRLLEHVLRGWLVVFPFALVLFVGNENLERLNAGLPAPGLGVLGPLGYPGSLFVIAAVSLLVALVDALYRWRLEVLVARIEAARARWARARQASPRPRFPWVEPRHGSIVGHLSAGRAPPAGASV